MNFCVPVRSLRRDRKHGLRRLKEQQSKVDLVLLQGKGNKVMDQIFESFMKELREEKGEEASTVTGLCQKERPAATVKVCLFVSVCTVY